MTINERFKAVRNALGKNQSEFAEALGFAQTGISMIESHKRDVSDRHIKAICSIFNISEHWLRTGEGNMYVESEASLVDSLAKQMNMSAEQKKLMEIFLSMSDEKRDSISRAFFDFLETARHLDAPPPAEEPPRAAEKQRTAPLTDEEIEAELADYRAELLAERTARSASEDGSAKRA
jgi:transcriptional regulator with XRE-family HTH domain